MPENCIPQVQASLHNGVEKMQNAKTYAKIHVGANANKK